METSEVVIHKGEKDLKYQLYVEDYVISYLKKYGISQKHKKIFFFGTKERETRKYYIYGAGWQKQIPYFNGYEKLGEISCRFVMDMPVFYIREDAEEHELSGYYIFYQSNEAMQSYMIEQRKEREQGKASKNTSGKKEEQKETDRQAERAIQTEQKLLDIKKQKREEKETEESGNSKQDNISKKRWIKRNDAVKGTKGSFMMVQLTALFILLTAIIINATNSYGKLEELNQAAAEVFFAMENEDAVEDALAENAEQEEIVRRDGTTLYLTELDRQMEEENKTAAKEDTINKESVSEEITNKESISEDAVKEDAADETDLAGENEKVQDKETAQEVTAMEEAEVSEQAFARDFAKYYQIEKGDTLYTISRKIYGNTSKVEEICELNQISDPDNIKYGQKILLP